MDGNAGSSETHNMNVDEGNDKQHIYKTTKLQSIKTIGAIGVKTQNSNPLLYYIILCKNNLSKKYEGFYSKLPRLTKKERKHYLHYFKEFIINYKPKATIKTYYSFEESLSMLKQRFHFYQNYIKYYCIPFFKDFKNGKIIKNCKRQKAKLYILRKYPEKAKLPIEKELLDLEEPNSKINFFTSTVNNKINEKSSSSNNEENMFNSGYEIEFIEGVEDNKLNNIKDNTFFIKTIQKSTEPRKENKLSKSLKDNCKSLIYAITGEKYEKDSSKSKEKSDEVPDAIDEENSIIKEQKEYFQYGEMNPTISYNLTTPTISYNLTTNNTGKNKDIKESLTEHSCQSGHIYKTICLTGESQTSNKLNDDGSGRLQKSERPTKTFSKYSKPIVEVSLDSFRKKKELEINKKFSIDKQNTILKRLSNLKPNKENSKKDTSLTMQSQLNKQNIETVNRENVTNNQRKFTIKKSSIKLSKAEIQKKLAYNKESASANFMKKLNKVAIKMNSKVPQQNSKAEEVDQIIEEKPSNKVKEEEKDNVKRPKSNSLSKTMEFNYINKESQPNLSILQRNRMFFSKIVIDNFISNNSLALEGKLDTKKIFTEREIDKDTDRSANTKKKIPLLVSQKRFTSFNSSNYKL